MSLYLKWGIALLCAIFPLYCLFNCFSVSKTVEPPSKYVPKNASAAALSSALSLWHKGDYQQAVQVLGSINPSDQAQVVLYKFYTNNFLTRLNAHTPSTYTSFPKNCRQKILFVTGDLQSLKQGEHFKQRFTNDERLKSLSICIEAITWFDSESVSCDENWQDLGRLGCDIKPLAKQIKYQPFTHLVIFADKGKANVDNGIMFLDRQDTYDVFVHELAHFSGFIDEYPLSKNMAARVCEGIEAPNMVFKKAQENTDSTQLEQAKINTRLVTLSPARTCDNHTTQAFKTSKKLTFMEYHDTAYIPPHYLTAWQMQLQNLPSHPSAHINFAQLFEDENNQIESQFWRKKYQQYLKGM